MAQINPYINFNGNCEAAFNFYKSVFKNEFDYIGYFGEMPPQEGMPPLPEEDKNKVMHVSMQIGGGTVLMGSDCGGEWAPNYSAGNNFSLSLNTQSREEADALYAALSEGGNAMMPMNNTFWGAYFGMLIDKFGISWMLNYDEQPK